MSLSAILITLSHWHAIRYDRYVQEIPYDVSGNTSFITLFFRRRHLWPI